MFKIILGWVQQHIAATIIVSVVVVVGAVATPVILFNGKETPKEEEKQPEVSQSVMLKEDLNFEINSELSLLSLVSEDNKVKVVSENEIVDTSTLGEKELVIKYLDNDQEKEQHFKINIVDTTKPIIEFQKELSTTAGTKIDLLKNVKVSDNSKEEIKATIEGDYNFDTEGTYNLKYVAVDSSNNRTEEDFVLKVNKKQSNSSNNNSTTNNSTANNQTTNNNTGNRDGMLRCAYGNDSWNTSIASFNGTPLWSYNLYQIPSKYGLYYIPDLYVISYRKDIIDTLSSEQKSWIVNTCISKDTYLKDGGSIDSRIDTILTTAPTKIKEIQADYDEWLECKSGEYPATCTMDDIMEQLPLKITELEKVISKANEAKTAKKNLLSLFGL